MAYEYPFPIEKDLGRLMDELGLGMSGLAALTCVEPRAARRWLEGERTPPAFVHAWLTFLADNPELHPRVWEEFKVPEPKPRKNKAA